jgi:phosphatidylserine/phosphatidylglycerophosphate/cardiolipin synthase-like enzyme
VELDFMRPERGMRMSLLSGRGHYEAVVRAVMDANHSVWIATSNLKELMVEDGRAVPGKARTFTRGRYRSILGIFDELAGKGVDLRILHATPPSRAFRAAFDRHPRLFRGGLQLRACPRVHIKAVVVDGAFLYLGSANWTGAGLGAKGSGRRNFELGFITADTGLLDEVQALFDGLWQGAGCHGCRLRDVCEAPLDGQGAGRGRARPSSALGTPSPPSTPSLRSASPRPPRS